MIRPFFFLGVFIIIIICIFEIWIRYVLMGCNGVGFKCVSDMMMFRVELRLCTSGWFQRFFCFFKNFILLGLAIFAFDNASATPNVHGPKHHHNKPRSNQDTVVCVWFQDVFSDQNRFSFFIVAWVFLLLLLLILLPFVVSRICMVVWRLYLRYVQCKAHKCLFLWQKLSREGEGLLR